ncbi:hypothetical protein ElyMa_000029100 [Elysia marginata]|uniref:Uncharacterized protein n=1 Tax=Elysia marginata TaxID=1093978 RepID=A0AAV4ECJ0_9GAST|nr:hypothetical protein ElyMa_000029100 [Elysia marginata]
MNLVTAVVVEAYCSKHNGDVVVVVVVVVGVVVGVIIVVVVEKSCSKNIFKKKNSTKMTKTLDMPVFCKKVRLDKVANNCTLPVGPDATGTRARPFSAGDGKRISITAPNS